MKLRIEKIEFEVSTDLVDSLFQGYTTLRGMFLKADERFEHARMNVVVAVAGVVAQALHDWVHKDDPQTEPKPDAEPAAEPGAEEQT